MIWFHLILLLFALWIGSSYALYPKSFNNMPIYTDLTDEELIYMDMIKNQTISYS